LGNGAPAVVAHQIDLIEREAIAQVGDHLSHRGQRQVLADRGAAVQREVDGDAPAGAVRAILQAISDEGRLAPELVGSFAHMVLAALDEIALVIARADDPAAAMAEGRAAVQELLRRLVTP